MLLSHHELRHCEVLQLYWTSTGKVLKLEYLKMIMVYHLKWPKFHIENRNTNAPKIFVPSSCFIRPTFSAICRCLVERVDGMGHSEGRRNVLEFGSTRLEAKPKLASVEGANPSQQCISANKAGVWCFEWLGYNSGASQKNIVSWIFVKSQNVEGRLPASLLLW